MLGAIAQARELVEDSLRRFEGEGSASGVMFARLTLVDLALDEGDVPTAREQAERALSWSRSVNHDELIAWSLLQLGRTMTQDDTLDAAHDLFAESRERFSRLGMRAAIGETLLESGHVALRQQDVVRAEPLLQESLVLLRESEAKKSMLETVVTIAACRVAIPTRAGAEHAARLIGAVDNMREALARTSAAEQGNAPAAGRNGRTLDPW